MVQASKIINLQNTDKRWFETCIKAYLASKDPVNRRPDQEIFMILVDY
ncbi:1732_t:CDS:1, partial [Gigaspora margarita]